jgi:hypothetical protein
MHLFQLLQALDNQLLPKRCKLHMAVHNGIENPLDVYLRGEFDEWQRSQNRRNFEREFVVSLIQLPPRNTWLFVGAHQVLGCEFLNLPCPYLYTLRKIELTSEFDGRLVVSFKRPGRQSYLNAEKWSDSMDVWEIRPERMQIKAFPGYSWAMLTQQELDTVVKQGVESWRSALSAVSGVYLIADRSSGKLYVGSANAGEGIWSRWCSYAANGHGGNRELRQLLEREGYEYCSNFQYGVLEIADTHASEEDVRERESYWKRLLLTREYGLNRN